MRTQARAHAYTGTRACALGHTRIHVGSAVQTADGKEWVTEKGRRLVSGPLKWFYYYRRFFYQGGTHYIFFEVQSACGWAGCGWAGCGWADCSQAGGLGCACSAAHQ